MEWHFPLILLNRRTFSWKTDVFSVLKFVFFWYWKQSGNGLGLISLDESFFNNNSVCLTDYLRFSRLVLRARGYRLASLSDRIGSDRICLISLADSFFFFGGGQCFSRGFAVRFTRLIDDREVAIFGRPLVHQKWRSISKNLVLPKWIRFSHLPTGRSRIWVSLFRSINKVDNFLENTESITRVKEMV